MCEREINGRTAFKFKTVSLESAVGMVLAHDITEIRAESEAGAPFKGRAFRKGHVIRREDICHLQRLGKEHLYILELKEDEVHEDDAAVVIATALMGNNVAMMGEPREGRVDLVAATDGLLRVRRDLLFELNMLGDVMCATLHDGTVIRKGRTVAGTRTVPLVIKRHMLDSALSIVGRSEGRGVIEVKEMRRPRTGVVITGNEVFYGRIKDAFAPVIVKKVEAFGGEVVGVRFSPDDTAHIKNNLTDLLDSGADLLVTTGGMSVDPDDVTRHAVRELGVDGMTYGASVLPGAMFLVAYIAGNGVPVISIPACGMYNKTTVFDALFPRILTGDRIGRRELAELGHGGLCLQCEECRYPICPFCK